MARIIEDVIVIKFSKLTKDSDKNVKIVTNETLQAIEQVTQELVGDGVIVEVVAE